MKKLLWLLLLLPFLDTPIEAHHNGPWLPLVPQTPLMQEIIHNGSYTWCVNDTAAAYPNFLSQLRDVNDQYTARVGIRNTQVAWGVPFGIVQKDSSGNAIPQTGCMVQHNAIPGLQCGGCAAHIFYANWPVVVEYKIDLAYYDWRSAQGHELGHGVLGLHEQYDDISFTCLDRPWTVMSCGFSQVKYPQAFDVTNGCAVLDPNHLQFVGCGFQEPPCGNPCWNGTEWVFEDGWRFRPNADDGQWFDPQGRLVWDDIDPTWNGRYSPILRAWVQRGETGSAFVDGYGWLSLVVP